MNEQKTMSILELYERFIQHPVVTIDSRNCPRDSIFFALKGERFDGNQFAQKALAAGCAFAVIDNADYYIDERTLLVEDVLKALQQLAHRHRKTIGLPIIGITGTNGKTTTKQLIAAVLAPKYKVLHTEGNLINQIGMPLTLLRLNHEHEMAVIEMGASHPGDIQELVEIVHPDYGLITNVGCAHLEGFGDEAGVLRTKGELYDYLRHTHGKIFIKRENKALQSIAKGLEQITYGSDEDAFAWGKTVSCDPFLTLDWKQQGKIHQVETHLVGSYNLDNVLAAVAVGRYFKIPAERISRAIAAYQPTNHRSQFIQTAHNRVILDAYNANPSSMRSALDNFELLTGKPKGDILGDMKELGPNSLQLHADLVEAVKSHGFDQVWLCGDQFSQLDTTYPVFPTLAALKAHLQANPIQDHLLLVKGSHSMHMEELVELL